MPRSILLSLLLTSPLARAGQTLTGDYLRVSYSDDGTWNLADTASGLECDFTSDGTFYDVSYPGTPYTAFAIEFTYDGAAEAWYTETGYGYATITADTEEDLSTADELIASYGYTTGELLVSQEQSWAREGRVLHLTWVFTNAGTEPVEDLRMMWAVDADQDYAWTSSTYTTSNDVLDVDGDGVDDWVQSVGYYSGHTVGFGACDPDASELGHYSAVWAGYDADLAVSDYGGGAYDVAMVWKWAAAAPLAAGESTVAAMVVVLDETEEGAQDAWLEAAGDCVGCDADADGYASETCGGDDCDDDEATTYPGARDRWYDGVDSDCAGDSDYDADGDGYDSDDYRGEDCDDTDATIHPGAADTWYDGVDQDCDEASDYDADGDGYDSDAWGGEDCDDADAEVSPAASETWYDGADADCDGASDYDADGDGDDIAGLGGGDCDDRDPSISSTAAETWYDGVDQDCDEASDYDADADGFDSDAWGGEDCDDADPLVNPDAAERWYDGTDADCAGDDDFDADVDGEASADHGGTDCDDTDAAVNSAAVETWYDGVDQDCDGNDADADGDGAEAHAAGGVDCDDTDPAVIDEGYDDECNELTGDGGSADGGSADGGGADGGSADGGSADGGSADGGSADGGSADGGSADGGDDDDKGEGCAGCASTAGPGAAPWGLAALALLALRRRR